MPDIAYVIGDATTPVGNGPKIICHVCNDIGAWGAGFVLAISRRWPQPEAAFRDWFAGKAENDFALGAVQLVAVGPDLWVANMIGQRGIRKSKSGPPIRYEAVEASL